MSEDDIHQWNIDLHGKSPEEIIRWSLNRFGSDKSIVSTSFGPYTAVFLHIVTQINPFIPILWIDHGYNRASTYKYVDKIQQLLDLNLQVYSPRLTAARRDALFGPLPINLDNESALREFSALMKLEPFSRAMKELKPQVWFTGIRRTENSHRKSLDTISFDSTFHVFKINPLFYWTDEQMSSYLIENNLPNELDYFDPAKGDDQRECGLHTSWAKKYIYKQ
ncbi:unnamed protein product [Adineta ricciae]|uniref:Phosphoadenosine phosphosulphate reductase domain-containing protein n=1 Tax=Adineta ricciae TaxID=249248 RepID=A0A815G482_ADIRI|nr:unnamed protein product [Adineta ricciae]CAF1551356.1 unnamed protein product [Adineta ricciae]